ncbi:hypothetical protein ACFQW6_08440 [Nocardioides sp. GCM10028917]|uniref:hypothetical protein n=1 Tax=Nocardioides sp. GCM10028917 TaxID=3273408 RepID=UPI00361548D3
MLGAGLVEYETTHHGGPMNAVSLRRAAAVGASLLALTACSVLSPGSEFLDQGPRGMAEAAFSDMREVTSMRVLGSQEGDVGFTRVDLKVDKSSCVGSLDADGGGIQIIKNADGAWFKGNANFWLARGAPPQRADQLSGGWLVIEGKDKLLELCDLEALLESFELHEDDTDETIEVGEVEEIGDADAVALTGQDGKERVTAWVAVTTPHRVLKMAPADDGGRPDELYFEEFGVDVVAESPAKRDIVTLPEN